jgi:hypothetical protein
MIAAAEIGNWRLACIGFLGVCGVIVWAIFFTGVVDSRLWSRMSSNAKGTIGSYIIGFVFAVFVIAGEETGKIYLLWIGAAFFVCGIITWVIIRQRKGWDSPDYPDPLQTAEPDPGIRPERTTEAGARYIASKNSDAFHLLTCRWAAEISEGNKVYFETFQDAVSSGRLPCGVCKPKEDLRAWMKRLGR